MNPRDLRHYRVCRAEGCTNKVLPPRVKCNACRVSKVYTKTELKPSRKGSNAVGTALHRPEKSRVSRAKRQNSHALGSTPDLVMTRWDFV